jgi:hypothetical protein
MTTRNLTRLVMLGVVALALLDVVASRVLS